MVKFSRTFSPSSPKQGPAHMAMSNKVMKKDRQTVCLWTSVTYVNSASNFSRETGFLTTWKSG